MKPEVIAKHLREIHAIARKYGALRLRLFGSFATGNETEESDLDFLVDLEEGRDLLDVAGLKQELEVLLGRRVDLVEEEALSPSLRERVVQEATPV